jgi:hypothetical protein
MRKIFSAILMLSVLLLACSLVNFSPTLLAQNATLYIDPPDIAGLNVGETFKINVTVSNVIDLYGWQLKLTYRNDALNATSMSEGPFLKKGGASTFFYPAEFTDNYNSTHGLIIVACTRTSVENGVDGSGTLVTIAFKVKAAVSTVLHLFDTKLIDSASPFGNPIPHTVVDGEVYAGFHDVAVINAQVSATRVYEGQLVEVNVTVRNNGDYAETFNVTTYYDANAIGTRFVNSLSVGSQSTLTFTWDTRGVETDRTYTIKAEATGVPGETNLDNNVLVDGAVTVRSYPIFLIKIAEVIPCNQSGYPATRFEAGFIGYFKAAVNNTSFQSETVLVTVNVYDSSNTTLGVVSFKGNVMPGISTFILGLPIPSSASRGLARVYANAFTDWPYFGGVPYCPEVSATFEIVSP